MDNRKERILSEVVDQSFNIERFKKFSIEFFNEIEVEHSNRRTSIWKEYERHIGAYYRVGKYTDSDDKKILILAVEIKKERSVEYARTMQRNFISRLLTESLGYEGAFVAFYSPLESNWRLSLVRLDYTFGEAGLELDLTPARRYSYLIGKGEPSHTAKKQLITILKNEKSNPTIDEIEAVFSVERVTKDFFEQYKRKYLQLKEYLEQDDAFIKETQKLGFKVEKFSEQFSKKLMGQLAFLYFLQKKGWLGVKIVPKKMTQETFTSIYEIHNQNEKNILDKVYVLSEEGFYELNVLFIASNEFSDYDAEVLTNIFINQPSNEEWGSGYKRFIYDVLWKHCVKNKGNFFDGYLEPFFYEALNQKRANHYFKKFNCKIPFLNGGLFEPLEGYDWRGVNFNIPNELFSNANQKGRNADGILDIFERFNFTINEDEPLEKEVAVDPEMLGKIFENLLDVNDRKASGAFYTPREIVHYMCQESIINYLKKHVEVPYEDLREFVLYSDLIRDTDSRSGIGYGKELRIKRSVYDNIINIEQALKNIKIADPAVGSGAFPLGMLSEIVRLRNSITDYLVKLSFEEKVGNKYSESQLRRHRSLFELKKYTIQNSIFAVDIENSAVDITKLRLWLSVVVDQKINDDTPHPQPLPNLEMNIMTGNSLIDEYEGIKLFDESVLHQSKFIKKGKRREYEKKFTQQMSLLVDHSDEMLDEMFKLQDRYFDEEDGVRKKEIKSKIDQLREYLIEYKLGQDGNHTGYERYKKFAKEKKKPYFLWYLEFAKVFKENGGFDVVIGNPPYVGESGNKEIFRPIAQTEFGKKYYQGKMDLFYFFFHLANDISNGKGVIAFITTNYFLMGEGALKLRLDIKKRNKILKINNFNELRIFESAKGQHNQITFLEKTDENNEENIVKYSITKKTGTASDNNLRDIINNTDQETIYFEKIQKEIFDENNNIVFHNPDETIIKKMNDVSNFKLQSKEIGNGIDILQENVAQRHVDQFPELVKGEGVFAISNQELFTLNLCEKERKIIKPYFSAEQLLPYGVYNTNSKWIIYTDKNIVREIDGYPKLKSHLDKFTSIITSDNKPYGLHRAREEALFKGEKILSLRMTKYPKFTYADDDTYVTRAYLIIKVEDPDINLKYLLGLLNSKLMYYWFYHAGKRKGQQLQIDKGPMSAAPLYKASIGKQEEIGKKINIIINRVKENGQDSLEHLEVLGLLNEIDEEVYKLYGLTESEKNIVESFCSENR